LRQSYALDYVQTRFMQKQGYGYLHRRSQTCTNIAGEDMGIQTQSQKIKHL
jgi:hypothetical protein